MKSQKERGNKGVTASLQPSTAEQFHNHQERSTQQAWFRVGYWFSNPKTSACQMRAAGAGRGGEQGGQAAYSTSGESSGSPEGILISLIKTKISRQKLYCQTLHGRQK